MSNSELDQWLQRLEAIHPREIELGLERSATVAHAMGLLPVTPRVITVAGTNGKGSTIAVLEALVEAAGMSCGVYTSPHLLRFNERIRIHGREASDDEIVHAFAKIERARGDTSLTYFEFATLAALEIFSRHLPDVLLLEVGLGGRLDAVNIVDASVAVITSIDLDHQDWLGDTREAIAVEKAGILRSGHAAVIADRDPPQSLRQVVEKVGAAPALFIGESFHVSQQGQHWQGEICTAQRDTLRLPELVVGSLLPDNICAAVQAAVLAEIEFTVAELPQILASVNVSARREFQQVGGLDYILDVAHNPAAVDKLLDYMALSSCKKRKIAVFSAMSDKDIRSIVSAAANSFDAWFLADQPARPRAARAEDIAAMLREAGQQAISCSKNVTQALRRAQSIAADGDTLVVFGSFFTVADAMRALHKDRSNQKAM